MKAFSFSILSAMVLTLAIGFTSCDDANEYEDASTTNPSFVNNYNDTLKIDHPASIANTTWIRSADLKTNAYGEAVQGFVESLRFVSADSVAVKMSQGVTEGTWTDDSNTDKTPYYEYTYSSVTGKIDILKTTKDDKGKVSKSSIFNAVAVSGKQEVMTVVHYGDTPVQTYLVKQ
ncbi:MAG: hypothetical protein K6G08_11270 [Prevotella sp.]|jgi:hypothetical protein|nr:hypothetical protein [Prevotella sp.]